MTDNSSLADKINRAVTKDGAKAASKKCLIKTDNYMWDSTHWAEKANTGDTCSILTAALWVRKKSH